MNRRLTQRTTLSVLIAVACLTAFGLTPAQTAHAQGTVATLPLQRYGLGNLHCAAYSPDGRYIATGGGGGAVLRDAETGAVIRTFSGTVTVISVAFSPDGTKIVAGYYFGTVKLWDAATGTEIWSVYAHGDHVWSVAFSPDGTKILTGSNDSTAKLLDTATGALIRTFSGHAGSIYSVAFSLDGTKILTGAGPWTYDPLPSSDNTAKLWDAATGAEIRTFSGHTDRVRSVAFSPDGAKILTGSSDKAAKLWNAATGAEIRAFSGHSHFVSSVAFSPDGTKVLTGSYDMTAKLWNAATGAEIRTFSGHTDAIYSVAFSPDGTKVLMAAGHYYGADENVKIWDAATGAVVRTLSGYTVGVFSIAFSPDGTKVLTGDELWDAATGALIRNISGTGAWRAVAFSPDGTKVLTGDELWDATTGALIRTFPGHTNHISSAVFSPNGTNVLTGSWDQTAKLWDAATGALIRTFVHTDQVSSVAFSPDGTKVLTGGGYYYDDCTAKIWDAATGDQLTTFTGHTAVIWSVAFSPDGRKVLTGSGDGTAKIWDAATAILIRTFPVQAFGVLSAVFSPDGTEVLTGSGDSNARLWDTATGAAVRTFDGHTDYLSSVAFSPDGTKVLTGSWDGTACVWELNPPRAIVVAGGGDYAGNPISDQTNDLGAYAYKTLKRRGYEAADIEYLTAFPTAPGGSIPPGEATPWRDADGDGLNDVDGWATEENLREAITGDFGQNAGRLLILMMDHGYRTQDLMAFRLNEAQVLPSTSLDGWLDDLQTTSTAGGLAGNPSSAVELTLVVDSCYSGQMVEDCRLTTTELTGGAGWHGSAGHDPSRLAGKKRIVIASTEKNKEAVFLPAPDLTSFMYSFLSSAYMGNSMGEAWRAGKRFFDEFPVADQAPQLDDGTTTSTPGATSTARADKNFFGATWAYGVQSTQDVNDFFPAFEEWITHTLVSPGDPVTLRAKMLFGQDPLQVVAVVRPPAPDVISGDPVTNLPHLYLARQSDTPGDPLYRVWELTTSTLFSAKGDYTVSFTARFDYERVSNPVYGHVIVTEGLDPDTTPIRAILAVDDTADPALASCLEYLGPYAYSVYLDRFKSADGYSHPDWIAYYINPWWDSDRTDWPTASNVLSSINTLPSDIGRLYVHLIGESSAGVPPAEPGILLAPGDSLTASALDGALDALQSRQTCAIVLVVDAPGSGAFLPVCRATGDQQRAIFTSGRDTDAAFFLGAPTLTSFSQKFLGAAYQGNDLRTAFQSGGNFFNQFLRYFLGGALIKPQMDDNGDGLYSAVADGALARTLYLGRRYAFAGDEAAGLPFILDVTTTQTVPLGGMTASYTVRLIEGLAPTRVFAQVTQHVNTETTATITAIPEIELTRDSPTSWTWSGTVIAPYASGAYTVTVYAAYPDSPNDKLSEPAFSALVVQQTLSSAPDIYDLDPYNDDASTTTLNTLSPGAPQAHTIHAAGNKDWFKCIMVGTATFTPYSIQFSDLDLNPSSAVLVRIYEDGPDLPATNEAWIDTNGQSFGWLSTSSGVQTVYLSVEAAGDISPAFEYTVVFNRNTGANNGLAKALGSTAMNVSWDNGAANPGSTFNVQRSMTAAPGSFVVVNSSPIPHSGGLRTEHDNTGLSPLTVYFYKAQVVPPVGNPADWTAVFYGVTLPLPEPPAPPTNPGATGITQTAITWMWQDNASNESGYEIFAGPGATAPLTSVTLTAENVQSWPHTGLSTNTQYAFQTRARNAGGVSAKTSNISRYTLAATPGAPLVTSTHVDALDVAVAAGDGNPVGTEYAFQIQPEVGGAGSGRIWVQSNGSVGATPAWRTAAQWGASGAGTTVAGLEPSTVYSFTARARNGDDVETSAGPVGQGTTASGLPQTGVGAGWMLYE